MLLGTYEEVLSKIPFHTKMGLQCQCVIYVHIYEDLFFFFSLLLQNIVSELGNSIFVCCLTLLLCVENSSSYSLAGNSITGWHRLVEQGTLVNLVSRATLKESPYQTCNLGHLLLSPQYTHTPHTADVSRIPLICDRLSVCADLFSVCVLV